MAVYQSGEKIIESEGLDVRARTIAQALRDGHVGEDDAVALLLRNDIAYLELMEGCRYMGARYVVLNWHLAPRELADIIEDSGAKALIGHDDLLAAVADTLDPDLLTLSIPTPASILSDYALQPMPAKGIQTLDAYIAATDPYEGEAPRMRGLFAYTSGSTGRPKGIKRALSPDRPDTYLVYRGLARDLMQTQPGDRFFVAAPLYHSAPNALAMMALAAGDVDIHIESKFDPENFLKCVHEHQITHAYIVPTMMVRLLKLPEGVKAKYDTSSLRYTVGTGSPCPVEVKNAMIDWMGPIFNESYGASEIGFMTLVTSREARERPGTVGKVLPGGEFRILDDDKNPVPAGEIGTIYVNLPIFGSFDYTNADGDLARQQVDGFTTVGDMGYLDDDGYLFICDRKKDMIISGGANIFPAEIEAEILKMPEVADCAVFGAPDPEFGEKIVAAVQLAPSASLSLETMRSFLADKLAKFKLPRILDIHTELPREDSGKIFKARLRDRYWAQTDRKI